MCPKISRPTATAIFWACTFKLVNAADRYQSTTMPTAPGWRNADDKAFLQELVANSETMTIVGVVQPRENASAAMLASGIAYPASLTARHGHRRPEQAGTDQLADPQTNVLNGEPFGTEQTAAMDMASLFSIDTDQLESAFQFDPGKLVSDLSGAFDLSDGSGDLSSSSTRQLPI